MDRINRFMGCTIVCLVLTLVGVVLVAPASAATTPPKVVFIGDWLTDSWSAMFPANWINKDQPNMNLPVSQQMAAAIALKPTYIHFMVGSEYVDDDASLNLGTALLEEDLITAITDAQSAHIPIFIGIEPIECVGYMSYIQMDIEVYAIASKYGVPIINYNGAINGTAEAFELTGGPFFVNSTNNFYSEQSPTPAGLAIMTMMAQTAFATLNVQPKSVYLQDVEQGSEDTQTSSGCCATPANVNTVSPGNTVQFYPVVTYTNGVVGAGFNSNFATGSNGTWTSSNPLVGAVTQTGTFYAFNQGTTIVKFTLPNGVWNEWIMYVGAPYA